MARALGWQRVRPYYENQSKQRPARASLDAGILGLLRKKNAMDFELYDFARELARGRS